jgi:hypothetical protein
MQFTRMSLAFFEKIQQQYMQAGFPLTFSGVNIWLIEDACTESKPVWQARFCSVIVGLPKRHVIDVIKKFISGGVVGTAS